MKETFGEVTKKPESRTERAKRVLPESHRQEIQGMLNKFKAGEITDEEFINDLESSINASLGYLEGAIRKDKDYPIKGTDVLE